MRVWIWSLAMSAGMMAQPATTVKTGPEVGVRVPRFEAMDQNGRVQTLESLAGPKGVLLVFHRSADWCPFCKGQLVELEHDLPRLRAEGFGLAAISYDSVAVLKNFADRKGISFPLLSDPDSKMIQSFGILDESAPKNSPFAGIPHPGTYLVDRKGVVLAKYFADNFQERDTAGELLLRQLGMRPEEAHATAATQFFQVSTSASNHIVHQGQRISLVVDLELKPKMHVYAPGVQGGYIPIEWKMAEGPGFQAAAPVEYPKPQVLRLEVIKETVPVYLGRVRLMREVAIGTDAQVKDLLGKDNELSLEGSMRYQVCDDRECYLPANLPLKWVVRFDPLDRQRVPVDLQRKAK